MHHVTSCYCYCCCYFGLLKMWAECNVSSLTIRPLLVCIISSYHMMQIELDHAFFMLRQHILTCYSSLLELDRCFGFLFSLHLFSSKLVNKVYQSPVNVCFTIGQLYSVSLNVISIIVSTYMLSTR